MTKWVLPGTLRLPTSRRDGVDPLKLAAQYRLYGSSIVGMSAIEVTEDADGLLMINDGVTRATRVHRYSPEGTLVPVIVIDSRPRWHLKSLPRISER